MSGFCTAPQLAVVVNVVNVVVVVVVLCVFYFVLLLFFLVLLLDSLSSACCTSYLVRLFVCSCLCFFVCLVDFCPLVGWCGCLVGWLVGIFLRLDDCLID